MATPAITVEMSTDPLLTAAPTWDDITSYCKEARFKRGRERELEAIQAGQGEAAMHNSNRAWDPSNYLSTFYPLRPNAHIRVRATINSTTYPVMRGFIDGYQLGWDVSWAANYSQTRLRLVDAIAVLSASYIPSGTSYSAEAAETRVGNILDDVGAGWPAGLRRGIGSEGLQCLAMTYTEDQIVWTLLQEAMATGFADRPLWVDCEGKITSGDGAETSIIFGDAGGAERAYSATTVDFIEDSVVNSVVVTSDGFAGVVRRPASTDPGALAWGPRPLERRTLNASNADCTTLAGQILSLREFPIVRPQNVTVRPGDSTTLWETVLGLDIEDVITLRRRPPGGGQIFEQRFRITSVEWHMPYTVSDWTVTFGLSAMVFPTTAVLDNFDRANEGPPMTGWTAWSSVGLKVLSNQCAPNDTDFNDAYWTTAMTGTDVEARVTIATLPATGGATIIFARTNPTAGGGGAGDGYAVVHDVSAGTDTITLRRYDLSVATSLGSASVNLSDGDAIGIRCIGTRIEAWVRLSGLWWLALWATDSTHTGASPKDKLGLFNSGNGGSGARYDDFGGGTVLTY